MFFKSQKVLRVRSGNIIYSYLTARNCWEFLYEDITFTLTGELLVLPEVSKLNEHISLVKKRFVEIEAQIEELKEAWGDEINTKSAHISDISIENDIECSATILGDETWGDLGYDIWLRKGVIVNEGFGD